MLWSGGSMYDLNDLVDARSNWVLQSASAINDRGQIVCVARSPSPNYSWSKEKSRTASIEG